MERVGSIAGFTGNMVERSKNPLLHCFGRAQIMSLTQITINIWFESIQFRLRVESLRRFLSDFPQNPWTFSAKSGPLGIGHEVIGVVLPKTCLGFGFENGGEKNGRI